MVFSSSSLHFFIAAKMVFGLSLLFFQNCNTQDKSGDVGGQGGGGGIEREQERLSKLWVHHPDSALR